MLAATMLKFTPPRVELGDIVIWRHAPRDLNAYAAVVTAVGDRTISVNLISPDYRTMVPREAVLHTDDPGILEQHDQESGVWEYAPRDVRLTDLLGAIQDSLANVEAKLAFYELK